MGTLLRHGSETQKSAYLQTIANGDLRLQAFGVTEPSSGTDTTSVTTTARREGDVYVVSGQKIWTSRAEHSDLMLLLARTTPAEQVQKKGDGLSTFIVDMKAAAGAGRMQIRPIKTMMNHATTEVFFDGVELPESSLVGAEANLAKYLASEASWEAANVCLDTHGGFGFAAEYDVERKFRETRLYRVAPVSNNLVLAYLGQHVLGLPRSY